MRPVTRDEIVDYVTWTEQRPSARPTILAAKELRRIQVPECFTFLFENRGSVRFTRAHFQHTWSLLTACHKSL